MKKQEFQKALTSHRDNKPVMLMNRNMVLFCLLLTVYGCGWKSEKKNSSEYLDSQSLPVMEAFFQNIQVGKYQIALNGLLSKNENIDLEDSVTMSLQIKFNNINEQSGRFVSKRLLRQKKLDNDLGVYSYLVKYEKKYYRFVFVFYNNETEVKIFKFSFDDAIGLELEEAIKLYVN